MKSIKIQSPSIRVTHISHLATPTQLSYVAALDGLVIDLGLSNPNKNLHRKWLGSGDFSPMESSVYGLSWRFDLVTLNRLSSNAVEVPFRLLAVHKLNIDLFASHWPRPWFSAPPFLSGDPNASFVACEVSIFAIDLTERLEELRTSIDQVIPVNDSPRRRVQTPAMLNCVPRVELRVVCGDTRAHLISADQAFMLDLHTPGLHVSLSSAFRTICTTAGGVDPASHNRGVEMYATCHVFLQPAFVGVSQEDRNQRERTLATDDPLLGLDGVEILITNHTLGHLEHRENVTLQPHTSMTDISCMTDGVSINLWKLECINALRALLGVFQTHDSNPKGAPPSKTLNGFYPGVSVHFAVGCLTSVVTRRDINPTCDLELSRGLALRTGLSLQYSCMRASCHSQRANKRFAHARGRQQLGLQEALLIQAMAVANAEAESDNISALIQGSTWRTTCRTALSTRFAADDQYDANYDMVSEDKLREGGFISIPLIVVQARLRCQRQGASAPDMTIQGTRDISVDIPRLWTRLDLLNAYSTLLATQTLHCLSSRASSSPRRLPADMTVRLRVQNAHILCEFPLHDRLFLRVLSVSLERRYVGSTKGGCKSIVAWVPSTQIHGKWEELSQIRDASVTLSALSPGVKVVVAADGFRVVIPHQYILSELILNIGLTLKALRHLQRTVKLGHHITCDSPTAELPKLLPTISIHVHSVALEATDSPFEAKLGLIWRTGFQAQKVRVERELAFEAKLRAILASGDSEPYSDSTSQSNLHYHFTPKRTTSVSDARARLNMVHSNSWLSAISRQKKQIATKEDSILRRLRHATQKESLHVPLPIIIHTPEKAPPLCRAVIDGLSLHITQPSLLDGYQGFLKELGDMPLETEYSLLVPMHLEMGLKAARLDVRDYHLPLFNVPFSGDDPGLEFVTDLVIAEEMGAVDSVEWVHCPVVVQDAGIPGAQAFHINIPKTIMPVKSYASPSIRFCTTAVTEFTWGVSYNPAVQEIMRVVSQ